MAQLLRLPGLSRLYLLRLVLAFGIVGFVCAAVYIGSLLFQRQAALDPLGRGDVTWLIAQTPSEFARFEQRVSAYGMEGSDVDLAEVKLRLDIVANRLKTLGSDFLEDFIQSDPRHAETIADLERVVTAARPMVTDLNVPGTADRLLELLAPIYPKLIRLSVDANAWNSARVNAERQDLFGLQWVFAWVAVGMITCGLVFVVLLLFHNRLLTRAHQQLREQDDTLQTQNHWFDAALNNMSQGLCLTDENERVLMCNAQFRELFGLEQGREWQGAPLADLVPESMLPSRVVDLADGETLQSRPEPTQRMEDGTVLYVSHEPMAGGGWVSTFEDISERQRAQDRIAHMAHHDPLTGLPNRIMFWERTEQAIRRLGRVDSAFAVLYLDLDRFKEVNDTLGHPTGDELLREISARLQAVATPANLVARLGGDEFAILYSTGTSPMADTTALAEHLLEAIGKPYVIGGKEILLTTSIGIAFAPKDGTSSDTLIKKADLALYRAKELGANTFCCFAPEIEAKLWRRRGLEDDLRRALELGQFTLNYQPLISLATMKVVSGEALLRWNHPVHGSISPGEFIPIAEETGCIESLGEWVLRQAFSDAARWPDDIRVSVNLSPVQFKDATLESRIAKALAISGLQPGRVELEITESVLLQDTDANTQTLRRLGASGFSIVLDDFGTGYSSLSYLLRFPFDKIKIDQSFIRALETRADSFTIVQSIATLAKRLGMTTTAEGVETHEQLDVVLDAGCTEAQGYYFNRPLPEQEFRSLFNGDGSAQPARLRARRA